MPIGPFSYDGLKALLGMDLADALAPLMIAPKYQRQGGSGVVDVSPLAIPEGEGLSLPVKLMGEPGFYNLRGALVLIVPPAVVDVVTAQLAAEIAAGEALGPRFTAGASEHVLPDARPVFRNSTAGRESAIAALSAWMRRAQGGLRCVVARRESGRAGTLPAEVSP